MKKNEQGELPESPLREIAGKLLGIVGPEVVEDGGGQFENLERPRHAGPILTRNASQGPQTLSALTLHEALVEVGPVYRTNAEQIGLEALPSPLGRPCPPKAVRPFAKLQNRLSRFVAGEKGGLDA
jgi:hypothetical protein